MGYVFRDDKQPTVYRRVREGGKVYLREVEPAPVARRRTRPYLIWVNPKIPRRRVQV